MSRYPVRRCRATLRGHSRWQLWGPLRRRSSPHAMSRNLAIVPAYNEADSIGATVAELREHAPDFDVLVIDDGSTDDTGRRAARRRRAGASATRSTSGSAARCSPATSTRSSTTTTSRCRSTATASTTRASRTSCCATCASTPSSTWSPARASSPPTATATARRRRAGMGIRIFARDPLVRRRPARHRPDLGLPHDRPPRDRAVRPRLPARLSRGRGGAAAAPPPARERGAPGRHARAHGGVSSINATRSVYYMIKVLLAIFVGLLPRTARGRAGRRAPVVAEHAIWMDVSRLQLARDPRHRRAVRARVRARAPAAADRALRAAVAVRRRGAARASRSGAGLLEELAGAVGISYAPSALFAIAFGFVLVLLLHFSLVISRLADQNEGARAAPRHAPAAGRRADGGSPSAEHDREPHEAVRGWRAPRALYAAPRSRPSSSPTTAPPSSPRRCARCAEQLRPATSSSSSTTPRATAARSRRARAAPRRGPRARAQPRLRRRLPRRRARPPRRRCCSSSTPTPRPQPGCLDALRARRGAPGGWGAWQALVCSPAASA